MDYETPNPDFIPLHTMDYGTLGHGSIHLYIMDCGA